ncbi:MAG: hypothetical protein U0528_05325 [Anaerolineae bacterium]
MPSDGKYEIRVGLYLGRRRTLADHRRTGADHGDALILPPPQ